MLFVAAYSVAGTDGDIFISTGTGDREIKGKDAEDYRIVNAWMEARLKETESIRVGSTYADVAKCFTQDGGLCQPPKYRFVSILCSMMKIDVEFDRKGEAKDGFLPPPSAKVVAVSRPYFERAFAD